MTELLDNIFAIEVPNGTTALALMQIGKGRHYIAQGHISGLIGDIQLPPGSYEIMFTTKGVTEEQAETIPMEGSKKNFGYKDYEGKVSSHFYADHALQSLLKSKGLTAGNYLIIKKVAG
jgi:hypothetical protein